MDAPHADMPVIDVDSHWTEPADLWTSRAPASLRDRTLRVERNAEGVDQWLIEDGDEREAGRRRRASRR